MRDIDWTDYRQEFEKNDFDTAKTVNNLCQRWQKDDVLKAQKEFNNRVQNEGIRSALQRQTCYLTSGSKEDVETIQKNGKGIAALIRAGIKKQ